jgi:hypothetical protein
LLTAGNAVSELGVFAFCAAMGFVSAATISNFYQWVTSEPADFAVERRSMTGLAVAILLSMFAGPFIVVRKVIAGLRAQQLRALPALLAVIVAAMWSVCAGVFYLSLMVSG